MPPKTYINLANYYRLNGQPVVIEAIKLGTSLKVVAPYSFLIKWDSVKAAGWQEVDAPAGVITVEEWKRLVGG